MKYSNKDMILSLTCALCITTWNGATSKIWYPKSIYAVKCFITYELSTCQRHMSHIATSIKLGPS